MRLRIIFQLALSLLFFSLSLLFTLYEGSALLDDPFEWRWSTPFTSLTTDNISSSDQISNLDYLIYAAKFQPFFPSIMLMSFIYILCVTGYLVFRKEEHRIFYYSLLAVIMMVSCFMIVSDHVKAKYIYVSILLAGILASVLLAIVPFLRSKTSFHKTN